MDFPDDSAPIRRFGPLTPAHPVVAAWLWLSVGMAAGIGIDRFAGGWIGPLPILVIAGSCWAGVRYRSRKRATALLACALLGVGLGAARHHHSWWRVADSDIRRFMHPQESRLLTLHGSILSREDKKPTAESDRPTSRLIVRSRSIRGNERSRAIHGDFLVDMLSADLGDLGVGRPVILSGWLEEVPDALNPGEWSPRRFWRSRGAVAFVDMRSRGSIAPDPDGPTIHWRLYRDRVRSAARRIIRDAVDPARASLVEALVLGIREDVPQPARDAFRDSGTIHLLAISGLHLQVVAMFVMVVARRLGLGVGKVAIVVVVTSASYALLVTGGASVLRASVMAMALASATMRRRSGCFTHRMALSAFVVLWASPTALFDAGAQLSFLGTAGLYLASIGWQRLRMPLGGQGFGHPLEILWTAPSRIAVFEDRFADHSSPSLSRFKALLIAGVILFELVVHLAGALFVSVCIWLVTSVLVAYHFEAINPVAILANLPLVPATSLSLMLGLGGLLTGAVGMSFLSVPLVTASASLMAYCVRLLEVALDHGGGPWGWARVGVATVVGFYLLALAACVAFTGPSPRWLRRLSLASPLIWVVCCTWFSNHVHRLPPDDLEVEMLAVDHGLAVLIRWPDGQNWLYDCGQMGRPDVGRRIVAPALRARGVERLDAVFVTHADADHYNGLESLIESGVRVDSVLSTHSFFENRQPDVLRLVASLAARDIPCHSLTAGAVLRDDTYGSARILFPTAEMTGQPATNNARSLVMELSAHGTNLILTGDLEGEGLRRFALEFTESNSDGDCDILMAPHHGGLASNPSWFYEGMRPRLVLSSQGRNRFGMTTGLRSHIADYCPDGHLRTTAADGAIRLRWSPEGVQVKGFLEISPELLLPSRNAGLEPGDTRPAHVVLNP